MKKLAKFIPILFLTAFTPLMASAACTTTGGLGGVICKISDLFSAILPVLVAFGVVYFVWGMVQYFIADGEEAKKTGKDRIIYGIVGLAVIISIWGLVNIVVVTFDIGGGVAPKLDQVAGVSSGCTVPVTGALLQTYLSYVTCIINSSVIPLLFALAVVMFVWGTIKFFIIDANEEAKRAQGKQFMIWSIVALAAMLSVWALVGILGDTFGIKNSSILPQVTPPGATKP
jgi:hypothetical protein